MSEATHPLADEPDSAGPDSVEVVLAGEFGSLDSSFAAKLRTLREDFTRFEMEYQFGLREIETKLEILRDEFLHMHDYNPIEHVTSRVKSPESMLRKAVKRGIPFETDALRANITDIAGVRVICAFTADVYRIFSLLTEQPDITVVQVKDYIAHPKPNGYKSLHAIVLIPVFLSTGQVDVTVELQFRTIAMDFWASLEHKIFYKYEGDVPAGIRDELLDSASVASELDARMAKLHHELHPDAPGVVDSQPLAP